MLEVLFGFLGIDSSYLTPVLDESQIATIQVVCICVGAIFTLYFTVFFFQFILALLKRK